MNDRSGKELIIDKFSLVCDRCKTELQELGGLLFSPPLDNSKMVKKYHLCKSCFELYVNIWIKGDNDV